MAEGSPVLVGGRRSTPARSSTVRVPGHRPGRPAEAEEELEEVGAGALHARRAERDPAAAAQVLPSNGRRVVRALEVIEITGRPFTATLPEQRYHYPHAVQVGVDIDRDARPADRAAG